jgi:uncharacterized protein (TIGR04255 family)
MSDHQSPLPDYERPPVIEVIYGMQFLPIAEWRTPLVGALWQAIKEDYPKFKEMPLLAPVFERFDQIVPSEQGVQGKIELLDSAPLPRMFFLDNDEHWVMQVQNDRFHHNWKRMKEGDQYPRYNSVSSRFFEAWERFSTFLDIEAIERPSFTQFELTYINHIPVQEGRSVLDEFETVFVDYLWDHRKRFLPDPELASWNSSFRLPDSQGRLHISVRPAQRRKDKTAVLLLELTARGIPLETESQDIKNWFALGREWIVRGFTDITQENVQKQRWGRLV